MPHRSARQVRPSALLASLAAVVAAAALTPANAGALGGSQQRTGQGTYDVDAALATTNPSAPGAAARTLARRLGPEGVVRIDPATGTPRQLLRTDRALTGRSASAPEQIALDYVRAHEGVFGLTGGELAALGAPQTTVSPAGVRRLRWTQSYRGIPVLGAELRAAVARDGRLISLSGAPLPDASVPTTVPRLSAADALARVRHDAGAPAGAGGDPALVIFAAHGGPRLAWKLRVDADSTHRYSYVLDAASGAILKRSNLVRFADSGAAGSVWAYAPSDDDDSNWRMGLGRDGVAAWRPQQRIFRAGWITDPGGSRLQGENVHVYSDVDDDDRDDTLEEVAANGELPDGTPLWDYAFRTVPALGAPGWPRCLAAYPCSWRSFFEQGPDVGWKQNREQNATQVFWLLNTYKEHLEADPIGFGAGSRDFSGDDALIAQTDDGADQSILADFGGGIIRTIDHHPNSDHLNNANMFTPPDGESPQMQMYLFTGDSSGPVDANGGDDASIVMHEYTHGLSSRLITYDDGEQALNAPQSGAMGEAWSDWYAMDYLAGEGWQVDTDADGEVLIGSYVSGGTSRELREAAMDCPVDSNAAACAGGGFTYADYGKVLDDYGPEVHADGEIWGQTLWDLRRALVREGVEDAMTAGETEQEGIDAGVRAARLLVTEAMRSAPADPTFLEMRDEILAADRADPDSLGSRRDLIWKVFADRGMGYYAETLDAWDPAPIADDHIPPAAGTPTAALSGTVTDADTGAPIPDAIVRLPSVNELWTTTDENGRYSIAAALASADYPYPRLVADRGGYATTTIRGVTVAADGTTVRDLTLRRNWALDSGEATIDSFTGPDLTDLRCGPIDALDGTSAYGWGSYRPGYDGSLHDGLPITDTAARRLVLRLPAAIDVSRFEVDPGAICGDDDTASLGGFQLETSADGTTWTTAATGTFEHADNHHLNVVDPDPSAVGGVRWVRLTMLSPQGSRGAGDYFMDMAELGVYGTPTTVVDPPDPPDDPDPGEPDPGGPDPGNPDPGNPDPGDPHPGDPHPGDPNPGDPDPGDPNPGDPNPGITLPTTPGTGTPGGPVKPPAIEPPVRTAPARKPTLSKLAVPLPKRRSLATVLGKGGVPLRLRADQKVSVIATITLPASTARKLRMTRQRKGTVAIARLSNATVAANRTTVLRVRLPRNTRIWLDRARLRSLTFGVAVLATATSDGDIAAKTLRATARR